MYSKEHSVAWCSFEDNLIHVHNLDTNSISIVQGAQLHPCNSNALLKLNSIRWCNYSFIAHQRNRLYRVIKLFLGKGKIFNIGCCGKIQGSLLIT